MGKYSGIFESKKDLTNAFKDRVGVDGRIKQSIKTLKDDIKNDKFHQDLLDEINSSKEVVVFDYGGAGGIGFFRIIKNIKNKGNLKWIVLEVNEVVDSYNEFFNTIPFNIECKDSNSLDRLIKKFKGKKIIFYSIGTLQYLDNPIKFLKDHIKSFDSVYLKDLNSGEIPSFLTIQKGVSQCWFNNIKDFEDIFKEEGFDYKIFKHKTKFHDMSNFPKKYQLNNMCNITAKKYD